MLNYVKKLIENGYAYETSTAIYFDVSKLDDYGILSGINLREQKHGARVEIDKEKSTRKSFNEMGKPLGIKLSRMAYRMLSNEPKILRRSF